jgi:hypothetical protein
MATIASRGAADSSQSRELTPQAASRYAWWTWLTLLLAPFLLFLFVAYRLMDETGTARNHSNSTAWFIGTMAYLAVVTPLAIFYRSRAFAAYWRGEPVAPRDYLRGNLAVWLALETGGILALVGCLMTDSLLPCMLAAMAAFMFFVPFWPSGTAMVRPVGDQEDTGRYEEPR